jgi:hypothetical protein
VCVCGIITKKKGGGGVGNVGRTWVGGDADNLGASKAITVVALRADEEGRGVCRGVPPSLKTSEVYVLLFVLPHQREFFLREGCGLPPPPGLR